MTTRRTIAARLGAAGLAAAAVADLAAPAPARAQPAQESTFDRIRRTGILRISALPGEAPFFHKDLVTGEWSGASMRMARAIAEAMGVRLEYVEGTYASSVLDLQANKVDLAFALQPTPARALAIGFTRPYYMHPFAIVSRPGFKPATWAELNRPEVRVVTLTGASLDPILRRYAPNATRVGVHNGDEAVLALQSGHGDCVGYALIQALAVSSKLPEFGRVALIRGPVVALPSGMGVQQEPDRRFRDFLDSWSDYNNGARVITGWIKEALLDMGVKAEAIPADADL